MRRAARIDANQPGIVSALRKLGACVSVCSAVGAGFPDLVVLHAGGVYFLELKDGSKKPSDRETTTKQDVLHANWKRHGVIVHVVKNLGEAIAAIGMKAA